MLVTTNARPHCRAGKRAGIFSREITPTEQRVLARFKYHAGVSFRRIEPFVDCNHVAVHDWYHRLARLFEPDRARWQVVASMKTLSTSEMR